MNDLTTDHEGPTSALRRLLFRDSLTPLTPSQVVRWWESRRVTYNVAVGAGGVASLVIANAIAMTGPFAHTLSFPPLIVIAAVGVLANVCYTGGALAELAINRLIGRPNNVVGPTLFRYGTAFSVGVTLLPLLVAKVDLGLRILRWIF